MIKMLFKRVREYKTASILCPIVMVGEAVMEIIIPFLMTFIVGELEDLAKGKIDTVNGGKIGETSQMLYDTLTGIQWGRIPDTMGGIQTVE